ncbi:MAG: hypothetical protein LAQ69_15255 [Acidobacteriia bacterium]|nr:hypothetical protein [Terriglobia bacterium]
MSEPTTEKQVTETYQLSEQELAEMFAYDTPIQVLQSQKEAALRLITASKA